MTYYELSKIKERINIDQGDLSFDTILENFGLASDQEVDARLFEDAAKLRYLFQLPVLPLATPVDQSIRDASTNRAVAKWWRRQQNWQAAKEAFDDSERAITYYIARLSVDKVRYGVLV